MSVEIEAPESLRERILSALVYGKGSDLSKLYNASTHIRWSDATGQQLFKALGEQYENGCRCCALEVLDMSIAFTVPIAMQERVSELVEDIKTVYDPKAEASILNTVTRAIKVSILQEAVFSASEMVTRGDKPDEIAAIMADASSACNSVATDGADYILSTGDVLSALDGGTELARDRVLTGVDAIEEISVAKKELLLMLGATNSAKSFFLTNAAVANIADDSNVLVVSLEMSKEAVLDRIVRRAFQVTREQSSVFVFNENGTIEAAPIKATLAADVSDARRNKVSKILADKLRIIEAEEMGYSPADLRADVSQFIEDGWVPDVIVIDYIALMRLPFPNEPKRAQVAAAARQCRALGKAHDISIISVHQTNRDAAEKEKGSMTGAAESYDLMSVGDCIFEVKSTDEESDRGLFRLFLLKSRSGRKGQSWYCTNALDSAEFMTSHTRLTERIKDEVGTVLVS